MITASSAASRATVMDWADRFTGIVDAALRIKASSFLIDGEVVIARDDGTPDFHARRPHLGTLVPGEEPSTASRPGSCSATNDITIAFHAHDKQYSEYTDWGGDYADISGMERAGRNSDRRDGRREHPSTNLKTGPRCLHEYGPCRYRRARPRR